LFVTAFRPALGSAQPPIQGVPEALPVGVKRRRRKTDHLSPSRAKFKNKWSYTSFNPQTVFMAWCLIRSGDDTAFVRECNIILAVLCMGMKPGLSL
jgi:hypothetical protein